MSGDLEGGPARLHHSEQCRAELREHWHLTRHSSLPWGYFPTQPQCEQLCILSTCFLTRTQTTVPYPVLIIPAPMMILP